MTDNLARLGIEIVELDDGCPRGSGPQTVYVAYSNEGELLYVGQTRNLYARLIRHRKSSAWWQPAGVIRIVSGLTETEAFDVELRLIRAFDPPWNTRGRDFNHPRNQEMEAQYPHPYCPQPA